MTANLQFGMANGLAQPIAARYLVHEVINYGMLVVNRQSTSADLVNGNKNNIQAFANKQNRDGTYKLMIGGDVDMAVSRANPGRELPRYC